MTAGLLRTLGGVIVAGEEETTDIPYALSLVSKSKKEKSPGVDRGFSQSTFDYRPPARCRRTRIQLRGLMQNSFDEARTSIGGKFGGRMVQTVSIS